MANFFKVGDIVNTSKRWEEMMGSRYIHTGGQIIMIGSLIVVRWPAPITTGVLEDTYTEDELELDLGRDTLSVIEEEAFREAAEAI